MIIPHLVLPRTGFRSDDIVGSAQMSSEPTLEQLEAKLSALDADRAKLILEINTVRNSLSSEVRTRPLPVLKGRPRFQNPPTTPAEKIQLFLDLFRCRENVFPKRWENKKTGKQGYAPACLNEWVKPQHESRFC